MRISVLTPTIRPAGLEITREGLMDQSFQDFEWLVEIGHGRHDLNAAYNRMLRRAKGELVVSLQDYILIRPGYLQAFWDAYQDRPGTFMTAPVGKVDDPGFGSVLDARWDWRAWTDGEKDPKYRPCKWDCWEIDSGAAPLEALKKIGGFDEHLDQWWSFDNVSVGMRAEKAGYKFLNLFTNPSLAYDHDKNIPHPYRANFRPAKVKLRMDSYEEKPIPPLL